MKLRTLATSLVALIISAVGHAEKVVTSGSSASSSVSLTTGTTVTGGTANSVVFLSSTSKLKTDANLIYDEVSSGALQIGAGINDYVLINSNGLQMNDGGFASISIIPSNVDIYDAAGRNTFIGAATALKGGNLQLYDITPTLRVSINGIGDTYFNSASQVGIGTTTPTELLDIRGTGGTYALRVSTDGVSAPVALGVKNSGAVDVQGTATNDSAPAGNYGEYTSSVTASASVATSGQFGNAGQVSLTPGDWDVTGVCEISANGATVTQAQMAISTNSGNTTTDHVDGDNQRSIAVPIATNGAGGSIPAYRKSLSATTTLFVKVKSTYTVATPTRACRISARRAR